MWSSFLGGNVVTASLSSSTFIYDCANALVISLLAVSCCLAADVGSSATADFCTEQIASNYSCFNQYLQNQFDYKGLPGSPTELHTFCDAFDKGMECMDTFVDACLGPVDRAFYDSRMEPARHTMKQLCSKSELRDEYLRHASCYGELSEDWDSCAMPIKDLVDQEDRVAGPRDSKATKIRKICLAKEQFLNCTISATEAKCNGSAVSMLQRLAETLSGSTRNDDDDECQRGSRVPGRDDLSEASRSRNTMSAHVPSDVLSPSLNVAIAVAFASVTIIGLRAFS